VSGHPDLRAWVAGEELPSGERAGLLDHVLRCSACRAGIAAQDPSRLFALLALEPVPAEVLERVSRRASEAVDRETARRAARSRGVAFAAIAAAVLLAAVVGVRWLSGDAAGPPPPPVRAETAPPRPAVEAAPAFPASIELLQSPGDADVVELSVGDVRVVMIFDERLDI
jgi:hypothetical protein